MIVLTEFRQNANGARLKSHLSARGFRWQACNSIIPSQNSVFIAAKIPFTTNNNIPALEPHSHRILFAQFQQFNLVGVYFPQNEAKRPVFEFLAKQIIPRLGEYGLIIGDFNTGLPYIDEIGSTFACVDCFEELLSSGLIDSWRSRNPNAREFSWLSTAKNGFRIDHALATPALDHRIKLPRYIHNTRQDRTTDHSALTVEFEIQSV